MTTTTERSLLLLLFPSASSLLAHKGGTIVTTTPRSMAAYVQYCRCRRRGHCSDRERESKNSIEVERKMGELMAVDDGGVMGYVWGLWLLLPKFCLCFVSLSVICFDRSFVSLPSSYISQFLVYPHYFLSFFEFFLLLLLLLSGCWDLCMLA